MISSLQKHQGVKTMKILRCCLLLSVFLLILVSCSRIEESPFPSMQEVAGMEAGNITWKAGVIEVKEKEYKVDFGILAVLFI